MHDTIFACCSGVVKSAVSVYRISGPLSLNILRTISKCETFNPRHMYCKKLYAIDGAVIDDAMVVYFNAPFSFTGEDVVELYTHGSIAIAKFLIETILSLGWARLAEPGEFAKRAFLNNKMSLTQAEGLADLIDAETIMQQKQAINQMHGSLEKLYQDWRAKLLGVIALLEAYLDFPDEDIPNHILNSIENHVNDVINIIFTHINDGGRGEKLKNGINLVIFGPPNAGKSSLMNYLMQKEISIVSNTIGTTRDVIQGHLDIGGYPIILSDTAGIRDKSCDAVETEGIKRAVNRCLDADIKILVLDSQELDNISKEITELINENTIIIANKIDIQVPKISQLMGRQLLQVSLHQAKNIESIFDAITCLACKIVPPSISPAISRIRYRVNLQKALEHLERFSLNKELVLAAEDIRMALRCLEFIIGKIDVDEILGEIFSNFCIGK